MVSRVTILLIFFISALLITGCDNFSGDSFIPDSKNEITSATLIITNGTVIDGTGSDPIPDGFVAVQDNRILAVGRSQDLDFPEGVDIIDAGGGTILPGIINAHAHKVSGPATRRILFLLDGVTSVCDMMISRQMMSDLDLEVTQDGPGARGFKSGPMITAPGGYPGVIFGTYNSHEIRGEAEAKQAVNDLNEWGADYV
jgi:hypothetical protein